MADSNTIGKLFVQLLLDDDEFDLDEPEKQIREFGAQLDGFASTVEDVFTTAAKAVAAATAGIVASSAVVGAAFQAQMTQVGVIAGAVGDEFSDLEAKARELGATTAFSATEAADAMGILAGAGLKVNEVVTATGDVLALAGAGGTTLDVAASTLASTLSQFQLRAEDATRVTDVFAQVTAASQFRVEDLAEAMKYGGTVGAGFGWSLEQTVAALAMFRDMGLQGSMAGTALRSSMVGATTASAKNVETLAKYGLTMAQINPETHSFAEILQTVGESGMTTSDAMVVFGNEAGAAFMSLARAAAEGDVKYQEMVSTLESSSGAAAEMFGAMQDNVLGRFKELQSGAEEILLSIFDAMKGPLADVLDALADTLGTVIEYFQANSGAITERLQAQAGKFISWLQENQELIAVTFYEGAEAVVSLIEVLGQLAPVLDELVILVASLFIAKKVLDFATAVQTLIQGLSALRTAIVATEATLTAATGGIYLAVAAVGAFVAALVVMVDNYGEAERAARRLKMAQEEGARVSQEAADAILAKYGAQITASKEGEAATRKELAAAGELTQTRKDELDLIRRSTEEQLAQAVATGKLVAYNGQLRTVASLYEELEEEALTPVTARMRELGKEQERLLAEAAKVERVADDWERLGGGIGGDNAAKLNAQAEALREQAEQAGKAIESLTLSSEDAQTSLLETYARGAEGAKGLGKAAGEVGDANEDAARRAEEAWARAFQSATESGAEALERAREGYEDVLADEEEKLRLTHARELEDLERSQKKALAEVEDNEVARMIVTEQFSQARQLVEKRQAVEVRHFAWEQTKKELEDKKKALDEKKAQEEKEVEERKRIRARSLEALTALERGQMKESERLEAEHADFIAENSGLTAEEKARADAVYTEKKKDALAQERAETVAAVAQTAKDVASVMATVAGAVVDVARGIVQVGGYIVDALSGVVEMARKATEAVIGLFTAITGGEVSLDVLGYLSEALDQITSGDAGGASVGKVAASLVEEMAANAGLFLDALVEGLPTIVQALLSAMPDLVQAVAEALPILAEEVAALIPEVVAVVAENLPILLQGLAEALPIVIDALVAAIPDIVAVIADAVPMILQAVVENLPVLIAGIAQAIPDLVAVLVENLPTVVQGIVDNLPAVVEALAGAIPDLVTALAEALPELTQVVVDQLPVIIDAVVASIGPIVDALKTSIPILTKGIMDALPDLVMGLVNGILEMIPTLIEQLPVVVQGIVDLLPGLISAILGALPEIITSIIDAIPQIVMAILGAIPEIIMAIIAAIPDIIIALVSELPGMVTELVLAITAAIPEIIVALIEALFTELIPRLPEIVIALVTSLWESLVDLVEGLVDMLIDALTDWFGGDDDKDKKSNYSGISFVPATMRGVTLHKGEAVLTADENQRRLFGGAAGASQANPAAPVVTAGQGGVGPAQALEALFAVDGRIVDGVLLRANQNGRGKVTTMMKRRAGVRSGIKTSGRFKFWSK